MTRHPEMTGPGDDDRFGMPDSSFRAARENHADPRIFRIGMYVPTRAEVRTRPASWLISVLDSWFYESPVELIPTDAQAMAVRSVLVERGDADQAAIQKLIALCDDYVRPRDREGEAEDEW